MGLAVAATRLVPNEWLESLTDRPVTGPVTRLGDVVPILLIGTVAAVGAAWFPARSAARVPTLQALAGRRPQPAVPRRLPLLGALSVGGGLLPSWPSPWPAATPARPRRLLVAVAGSVAVLVGTLAIGPWAVAALERLERALARSRSPGRP